MLRLSRTKLEKRRQKANFAKLPKTLNALKERVKS